MTCPLEFTGSIVVTGTSGFNNGSEKKVALQFQQISRQFDNVVSTDCEFEIASAINFISMPLSDEMVTVDFIAFLVRGSNATTIEFLIGTIPTMLGIGGTFPTGFTGGEAYALELSTYNPVTGAFDLDTTVATTFTAAAQTAQDVVNEINAAAMLAGLGTPVAAVDTGGQIRVSGLAPGQTKRITNSTGNSTIGLASSLADIGEGTSIPVNGNFLSELASVPGSQLWLRGTGALDILLAGS